MVDIVMKLLEYVNVLTDSSGLCVRKKAVLMIAQVTVYVKDKLVFVIKVTIKRIVP